MLILSMGNWTRHRRITVLSILVVSFYLPIYARGQAPELARQAYLGLSTTANDKGSGVVVRQVRPDSPAEMAGLKAGDVVLRIDGKNLPDQQSYNQIVKSIRQGIAHILQVSRNGRQLELKITPLPLPKEEIKGVTVIYDYVVTEHGHRARTIITKPENGAKHMPAVLLIPWLSCDSIESPLALTHGWTRTLRMLAEKSGLILMRVERPGLGDSEGPDCSQNDLSIDLASYRAALQALKKYDFVDSDNVFLLGASLGGALAPILAQGENIRGLIVSGGFTKTWYEHMLEHERTRLELSGRTPAEINEAMRGYSEFYSMYLNQKLTPAEVIRRRPQYAKLWNDEPEGQYGRPASFFHQVQELNVERAWEKISVPVLVIYGEYDWIMSRADHELVANIINKRHLGNAQLVIVPKMNHVLDTYESMQKAFKWEGGKFDDSVATLIIDWLRDKVSINR